MLCAAASSAQSANTEVGFEGGPNGGTLRGSRFVEEGQAMNVSFAGGLSFQRNWRNGYSLRSNVHYDRKGNKVPAILTDMNGSTIERGWIRTTFEYISVPILARKSFGQRTKFIVNAGPYLGILIKATQSLEAEGLDNAYTNDVTELMESIDLGIAAGAGITRSLNDRWTLSLELRDNLGLVDVSAYPIYGNGGIKTNTAAILIGIACTLGERQPSPGSGTP
ncbi:MAG: PorT family protein [Flavobacteriales bacterium]|nr:PorT family protein [Flavobacteriales bacterium]